MRKTALILSAVLLALAGAFFLFHAERNGAYAKFSVDFFDLFDTHVSFSAYTRDEESFRRYAAAVRGEMERLHRYFDIYDSYGRLANLKTVNDNAGTAAVVVAPEIIELLDAAARAYRMTGGAVDISKGSLYAVWHDRRERALSGAMPREDTKSRGGSGSAALLPSAEELRSADAFSMGDIVVDREAGTVFLRKKGMRLDVGAVAKGFAAQRAVEKARALGLTSGILNAGGNVCVIGAPKDGRASWKVGVRGQQEDGGFIDIVDVADCSVVTSGDDQRYFTAGGEKFHHIIDPWTRYPAKHVRSVTVVHPNSETADILSTAAFVLPPESARRIIEQNGAEAMWVFHDGRREATAGYVKISESAKQKR